VDGTEERNLIRRHEIGEEERRELARVALGKFNFFIHVTGWLSGCAFLLVMGVLVSSSLPYVFIPIGLWTAGLAYHFYRAFIRAGRGGPPGEG